MGVPSPKTAAVSRRYKSTALLLACLQDRMAQHLIAVSVLGLTLQTTSALRRETHGALQRRPDGRGHRAATRRHLALPARPGGCGGLGVWCGVRLVAAQQAQSFRPR